MDRADRKAQEWPKLQTFHHSQNLKTDSEIKNNDHSTQLMGKQTEVRSPTVYQSKNQQIRSHPNSSKSPPNDSKQNAEGNQRIKNL